jgi:hypothetical protein
MTRCTSIDSNSAFDWPLAYEAEGVLRRFIGLFLERNQFANEVSKRMSLETGTDFYDWVDNLTADTNAIDELVGVGFGLEQVDSPPGCEVYYHPRAMIPRVIVRRNGSLGGAPRDLAIRPESVVDFVSRNGIDTVIKGQFGSGLRTALVAEESGHRLFALERLAYRGFVEGFNQRSVSVIIEATDPRSISLSLHQSQGGEAETKSSSSFSSNEPEKFRNSADPSTYLHRQHNKSLA